MDDATAELIAESWSGGDGLVPRGPRWLIGWSPTTPHEVERRTGRRPAPGVEVHRLEVAGRFLRSGGLVYPGGVPFPEDLQRSTAVVANEVWLYVTGERLRVLGAYWWPEAVRKPIAATPQADAVGAIVMGAEEIDVPVPDHPRWEPALATRDGDATVVFCVRGTVPDPLNEMLLFDQGGLSLRVTRGARLDVEDVLDCHQPPFREVAVAGRPAVGREPGRTLGPQTWPWPGELMWTGDGWTFELKGFVSLRTLGEVAETVQGGGDGLGG